MLWAEITVDDEILKFIDNIKEHTESFDEIKDLVFTKKRLSTDCTASEMFYLTLQFQEIKRSAIDKILNNKRLNFPEGFLIERLLAKYMNINYPSVEEHIKEIRLNSCPDRKSRRENQRKVTKLYNQFINSILSKRKE